MLSGTKLNSGGLRRSSDFLSLGKDSTKPFKKTHYQAQERRKEIVKELTSAQELSFAYLVEQTRELDIVLWHSLPNSLMHLKGVCGFIAMMHICQLLKDKQIAKSAGVQAYFAYAHQMKYLVLNLLLTEGKHFDISEHLEKLYSQAAQDFDRHVYEAAQSSYEGKLDNRWQTFLAELGSDALEQSVIEKLTQWDELYTLFTIFKEADESKDARGRMQGLWRLGQAWQAEAERVMNHQGHDWDEPLMHAFTFYQAALTVLKGKQADIEDKQAWQAKIEERIEASAGLLLRATNSQGTYLYGEEGQRLIALRQAFDEKLKPILSQEPAKDDEERLARALVLRGLVGDFIRNWKEYLAKLIKESEELLGKLPCQYSFLGFGSLEKQSCTPYSDLEFGILLEDGKDNEENRAYFRNLTHLLHAKIIRLGESPIPFSLFSFSFDHLTGQGFCFDLGGKISLGRRHDKGEKYGEKKYELIGEAKGLLKYVEDEYFAVDKFLPVELARCTHLAGEQTLTAHYQGLLQERLATCNEQGQAFYQERALTLLLGKPPYLQGDIETYESKFSCAEEGKLYDVKKEIYRVPDRLIDGLAFYYGIQEESIWDKLGVLQERGIISEAGCNNLRIIDGIAMELRLKTYDYYKNQTETLSVFPNAYETETFCLRNNAELMRFYYTALPLHRVMQRVAEKKFERPKLLQAEFFDDSDKIKANIYRRLHDFAELQRCSERIIKADAWDVDALLDLGHALRESGDVHSAVKLFEQTLSFLKKDHGKGNIKIVFCLSDIASCLNELGNAYRELGHNEKAIEVHKEALLIRKQSYGEKHPKVASSLNNLGVAYGSLREFKLAAYYLEQSLEMYKELYGENHLKIANTRCNLGGVYIGLGKSKEALNLLEKSLEFDQKIYGKEHPRTANTLNTLGNTFFELDEYENAAKYLKQSLIIMMNRFGNKHLRVSHVLNNLSLAYYRLKETELALQHMKQALDIRISISGELHLDIANMYNFIGMVYEDLNQYIFAIENHKKALENRKNLYLDDQHLEVATGYHKLGLAFHRLGQYGVTLKYCKRALKIRRNFYVDEQHSDVAESYNDLSQIYLALGKYNKALKYCKKALEIRRNLHVDEEHPNVAESYKSLGFIYDHLHNYLEAEKNYKRALSIFKTFYRDEQCSAIATSYNGLGNAYQSLSKYSLALEQYQKALKIKKNIYPSRQHLDIATSYSSLGGIYECLKEYSVALEYNKKALAIRLKLYPDKQHPDIAKSYNNLGFSYYLSGECSLAVKHLEKALVIYKKCYSENHRHPHVISTLQNLIGVCIDNKDLRKASFYRDALKTLKRTGILPADVGADPAELAKLPPQPRVSKKDTQFFMEQLKIKKPPLPLAKQLQWINIFNGKAPLPEPKAWKEMTKGLSKRCLKIANQVFNAPKQQTPSSLLPQLNSSPLQQQSLFQKPSTAVIKATVKTKLQIFHFQENLSQCSVTELIEIALQLDMGMYSHLPERWRNPGIAGLCAFCLLSDALQAQLSQCSAEVISFIKKIEELSQEALELLTREREQAFIKPLINELLEYAGGFERKVYTVEEFTPIKAALEDLPRQGQLVYRPDDGRFFVLIDNRYREQALGVTACGDYPRAVIGHCHVTVNEAMGKKEGEEWWQEALNRWGETDTPLYRSPQSSIRYLNKTISFEVIGAYRGIAKTNSRLSATHQLRIESADLSALAAEGLGPRVKDYYYHSTFAEQMRSPYPGLAKILMITDVLAEEGISAQIRSLLLTPGKLAFPAHANEWLAFGYHTEGKAPVTQTGESSLEIELIGEDLGATRQKILQEFAIYLKEAIGSEYIKRLEIRDHHLYLDLCTQEARNAVVKLLEDNGFAITLPPLIDDASSHLSFG